MITASSFASLILQIAKKVIAAPDKISEEDLQAMRENSFRVAE